MASSVKPADLPGEVRTDKIVIVTGPTFGTALKFMLLGAALGAAAALSWKNSQAPTVAPALPAEIESDELASRMNRLAARAKSVATRARNIVQNAADVAGPALQQAIAEGRATARDLETQLKEEVKEAKKEPPGPEQV